MGLEPDTRALCFHPNQDPLIPQSVEVEVEAANGAILLTNSTSGAGVADPGESSKNAPNSLQDEQLPLDGPEQIDQDDSIHFHVSSRHFMLACPRFEQAISGGRWSESIRNEEDGRFHIPEEDIDAEAFLIVLNALHLRNKQIPRKIDLETLAKIAVIIDYYGCAEAMEVWTSMWLSDLRVRVPVPSTYCRELMLWLCIAWVFDDAKQFLRASEVAIKQSTEAVQTLGLPISVRISDEVELRRHQAIESVVEGVHSLLRKYRRSDYECAADPNLSSQCGSFLLGALTRELDAHGLLSPQPEVPFTGLSFDSICSGVETMESPGWVSPNRVYSRYVEEHVCTLSSEVNAIVTKAKAFVFGLNLGHLRNV